MQPYLQEAQQSQATDILLLNGQVWYRVLGKLRPSNHSASSLELPPLATSFEQKSPSHIRCLPNDLSFEALNYPAEVAKIMDAERGLVLLSGPQNSGKTTLLLHWLSRLQNRSVELTLELPEAHANKVLRSSDQADIKVMTITDASDAMTALRDSIHQVVIAVMDGRSNADSLRFISLLLNDLPDVAVREMLSEQVVSLVNVNLIRTIQNRLHPLLAITNSNESISSQIADGHFHKLEDSVQRGNGGYGSISGDIQLAEWLQQRQISLDEALRFAMYPATMRLRASGIIHND